MDTTEDAMTPPAASHESTLNMVRLSARQLLQRGAIGNLTNLIASLRPADIARMIMQLDTPQERRTILELVKTVKEQGQVASELDDEVILEVLDDRSAADVAAMLRTVPADDAANSLRVLREEGARNVLPLVRDDGFQEVAPLMG